MFQRARRDLCANKNCTKLSLCPCTTSVPASSIGLILEIISSTQSTPYLRTCRRPLGHRSPRVSNANRKVTTSSLRDHSFSIRHEGQKSSHYFPCHCFAHCHIPCDHYAPWRSIRLRSSRRNPSAARRSTSAPWSPPRPAPQCTVAHTSSLQRSAANSFIPLEIFYFTTSARATAFRKMAQPIPPTKFAPRRSGDSVRERSCCTMPPP
jgi:hypothetical protein